MQAARSTTLTVNDFKEHFESVSKDRYKERPDLIERAMRGVEDLKNGSSARGANEWLKEVPETSRNYGSDERGHEPAPMVD